MLICRVVGEKLSVTGVAIMNAKAINGFESPDELRDLMGEPMDLAARKSVSKLDKYSKEYISRSPFVCIGSADETGKADVSPRGDPPGFVQVLDAVSYTHLTLPTILLV